MPISVTDPIGRAIARSKFMTFQPFTIAKWFTLGFVVFLAALDEGGGGNADFRNIPMPGGRGGGTVVLPPPTRPSTTTSTSRPVGWNYGNSSSSDEDFEDFEDFDKIGKWMSNHVGLLILIAIGGAIVVLAVWLLILWINSRAKFMLLDAIANDTWKVVEPWKRFAPLGNNLFRFRAALAAISLGILLLIGLVAYLVALPDIRSRTFGGASLGAMLLGILILFPLMITIALIDWATKVFITQIMFATGQNTVEAWHEFRQDVLPGNRWRFFLFLLMQGLLGIVVAIAQGILGCVTCCIGALPYLSSVIALPLLIFSRAYPIYFLQQFSPRYQIITEPPQGGGFPVMPLAGPGGYPPPPGFAHPGIPPAGGYGPPGGYSPPSMPPPQIPPPRY